MRKYMWIIALCLVGIAVTAGCVNSDEAAAYADMLDQFPGSYTQVPASEYAIYDHVLVLRADNTGTLQELMQGTVVDQFPCTWRGTGSVDHRIKIQFEDDFAAYLNGYYSLSSDGKTLTQETTGTVYLRS